MHSLARDAAVPAHEHLTPKTMAYRPASFRAPPHGGPPLLGALPPPPPKDDALPAGVLQGAPSGGAPLTGGTPPAPQRPRPSLSLGKITRDWRCLGRKDPTPANGPVDGVHLPTPEPGWVVPVESSRGRRQ